MSEIFILAKFLLYWYCDLLSFLSYITTHQNVPMVISDHQLGGFVVAGVEEGVAVGGEWGVGQLVGWRF